MTDPTSSDDQHDQAHYNISTWIVILWAWCLLNTLAIVVLALT